MKMISIKNGKIVETWNIEKKVLEINPLRIAQLRW